MAAETASRVLSSLKKRLPSLLMRMAPLPRTASVIISPTFGTTVGCVWISVMSMSWAPAFSARTRPSPVAPGWFVVAKPFRRGTYLETSSLLAPKPPAASTTALAWIV